MLAAYRRTGADLPFGDPSGYHGTGFEGYFWRITHAPSRTVLVVLAGVNRDRAGMAWGTIGLAAHPGGLVRDAAVGRARAARRGLHVEAGDDDGAEFEADRDRLRLRLGPDTRVDLVLADHAPWPRRGAGGIGPAHALPGLSQYWHPHLLAARVTGSARVAGREIDLDGAVAYGEKNWGPGGFPDAWWWGQAHGFAADPHACVAFAGGHAALGRVGTVATALAVRAGGELLHFVRPLTPIGVEVGATGWRLRARGPRHRVHIEAHPNGTAPHLLPVPLPAERRHLERAAAQHLAGELAITVRRGRRVLYRDTSTLAGLERGSTYGDGSGLPVRAGRGERQRFRRDQPLEGADRQPQGAQA